MKTSYVTMNGMSFTIRFKYSCSDSSKNTNIQNYFRWSFAQQTIKLETQWFQENFTLWIVPERCIQN